MSVRSCGGLSVTSQSIHDTVRPWSLYNTRFARACPPSITGGVLSATLSATALVGDRGARPVVADVVSGRV